VVDELGLQRLVGLRLRGVGGIERGGGERERFDQAAAADLAGLELVELLGGETFRDDSPWVAAAFSGTSGLR
jgi:hypothetical protein